MIGQITFQQYGNQQNWVNGKYHPSTSDKTISVISPYFDKEIATVSESNYQDLNHAVRFKSSISSLGIPERTGQG